MISHKFFESISMVGSIMRDDERPFGGIRVLMFGDFLQLPPVSKGGDLGKRVFSTDAWESMDPKIMLLTSVLRQTEVTFTEVLSKIRYGVCQEPEEEYIMGLEREISYDDGIDPVRLFAKRDKTECFNEEKLESLPGNVRTYRSVDTGDTNMLKRCPASDTVRLKIGAQVILIRNMDTNAVNGSIGVVVGFKRLPGQFMESPIVKFIGMDGICFELTLYNVEWKSLDPNGRVLASRRQLPILLSWAITIHRSMGATISRLCVDMSGIFEVGQAYVALSRCPDTSNLQVLNFDRNSVMASHSCVRFYLDIQNSMNIGEHQDPPVYVDTLPQYESIQDEESPDIATRVASETQSTWDSNPAPPRIAPRRRLREVEQVEQVDTEIMTGRMNLLDLYQRENSASSCSNSDD